MRGRVTTPLNLSRTSAAAVAFRASLPLKMTSSIRSPRRLLALCSPSTHVIASTTLLLPQPFGPTIAVTPWSKPNSARSGKLLNPAMCSLDSLIYFLVRRASPLRAPRRAHLRGPVAPRRSRGPRAYAPGLLNFSEGLRPCGLPHALTCGAPSPRAVRAGRARSRPAYLLVRGASPLRAPPRALVRGPVAPRRSRGPRAYAPGLLHLSEGLRPCGLPDALAIRS